MDLQFGISRHGEWAVLSVAGEIDVATAGQLRDQITSMVDGGETHLVTELDQVNFMDSTGLGVLVGAHKALQAAGGAMRVVCTQPSILKVFDITGLNAVIPLVDSLESVGAAE